MSCGLRLALCQVNATVGDLDGNATLIAEGIAAARRAGAQLVLFPELALTGYPPEDLLLREHFLTDTAAQLAQLAAATAGIVAIVGFPERIAGAVRGPVPGSAGPIATVLYNAAAVLRDGVVSDVYRKVHLPNYGVFDEQRYFKAGDPQGATITLTGIPTGHAAGELCAPRIGVTVCEDLWVAGPPGSSEAAAGASVIVNISASPYHAGKGAERERLFAKRARETGAHVAFCALVGGQDELVFDGHSFVLAPTGEPLGRAAQFEEDMLVCDLELDLEGGAGRARGSVGHSSEPAHVVAPAPAETVVVTAPSVRPSARLRAFTPTSAEPSAPVRVPIAPLEREVYEALMLGLHDYVEKNGFGGVVLGLSGGIDSALVACLAADALGSERVNVAVMPSPYSSSATQQDARALARALGVRTHEFAIEPAMDAYMQTLQADFEGLEADLTEENLQARIRGNLLMALSNKFGWLVLATGNKSEMSVGYTTLYGDLAGGFAVIKDVPKTLVYRLARWRNEPKAAAAIAEKASGAHIVGALGVGTPIPPSIIERAPSAELREDQTDQDSLPSYDVLDRILHGYIELDRSREQLIAEGLPAAEVERTARLVDLAEYKRRQAPPGIKITERAFGRDRRMPITNAYRG
jgi:NAD+ synthase (glutamine-hydrolysing)